MCVKFEILYIYDILFGSNKFLYKNVFFIWYGKEKIVFICIWLDKKCFNML